MADPKEYIPFCVTMKDKWYLEEKPEWDTRTKIIAKHMRHLYEWYVLMSPEEKAKTHERYRQLLEEIKALGIKVNEWPEDTGAVFT